MAPKTNKKSVQEIVPVKTTEITLNPVSESTKSSTTAKPSTNSKPSTKKRKRAESESLDTSSDYESENSLGVEESDDSIIVKDEEMSSEEASVNVAALSEKEQLELAKQEAEEFVKRQDAQKAKLIQEAVQLGLKPTTTRSGRVSVPSVEKIKRDREVIEAHLQDAKEQGKEVYRNAYKLIYGVYPDGQPGSDEDEDETETETDEPEQKPTKNSKSKNTQDVAEDDEFVPSYDEYSYEEEEDDEEYENEAEDEAEEDE